MEKNIWIKNKKGVVAPVVIVLGVIASLVVILSVGGYINVASILGYEDVYKQNWGNICCVQEFDYDIVYTRNLDSQKLFICDDYTNQCEFKAYCATGSLAVFPCQVRYKECDISGNNCGWEKTINVNIKTTSTIPTIDYGRSYRIIANVDNSVDITKKVKTFYIKGTENGEVYRQESCVLNSKLKERTLIDGVNELAKSGAGSCQNYLIDFIKVATKTYNYQGQEVICQARNLYRIETETFKIGGSQKFQGSRITSVECCPAEPNCDEDTFKFVEDRIRECDYDFECANGGQPVIYSGTSYIKYECIGDICVKSDPIATECTNNAICIEKYGEKFVCDFSPANWGKCKESSEWIGYCGDGICEDEIGETTTSCPVDCGDIDVCGCWVGWPKVIGGGCLLPDLICKFKQPLRIGFIVGLIIVGLLILYFAWPIIMSGLPLLQMLKNMPWFIWLGLLILILFVIGVIAI